VVESSGLLNRRTGLNLYRGFESPSLRHNSTTPVGTRRFQTSNKMAVGTSTMGPGSGTWLNVTSHVPTTTGQPYLGMRKPQMTQPFREH
jgi:hypothetical protein